MVAGATSALWGFSQGNLFERMESSKSMVPGSESDTVIQAQSAEKNGETITAIITGVNTVQMQADITDFRNSVKKIDGVKEVIDPVSIDAKFKAELEQQRVGALAAAGGSPQATAQIDAQFAQIPNPANDFMTQHGYALVIQLEPGAQTEAHYAVVDKLNEFETTVKAADPHGSLGYISSTLIKRAILDQVASDLVRGETIGLPVALFLLLFVFGGVIAAGLPLGSAIASIAITMGIVWGVTFFTNVDSFVLNIITIIGLALSIDYGLLVVSRYREQIFLAFARHGYDSQSKELPEQTRSIIVQAVETTIATAGRTVSFSAITIAFAIASLFVMDAPMLKMIAVGGVVVTIFAVFTAVTLVPALIRVAGEKLLHPSPLNQVPGFNRLFKRFGDATTETGFFSNLAKWVHKRPWPVLIGITTLLIVAAIPIGDLKMRSNFVEYIPVGQEMAVLNTIEADYPALRTPSVTVLADAPEKDVQNLVKHIEAIPGVSKVATPITVDAGTIINLFVNTEDPVGPEVTKVVEDLREYDAGYPTHVGGAAAVQKDFIDEITRGAPYTIAIIVVSVFVLLFLLTGSVIAPLKALLINTLSLVASIGITVFIFDHGLLGLPQTLGIETFVVACAAAFGFGLAMDYEVFLIARIKEYWDAGNSNDAAVEKGLQRSGRIITAAAAIIIAVFIGFIFGDLLPIRQIGVALAIIVFVDATLVRMLLVPALMTLLGKWNWWAPKFLMKFYERFKIVH